MTGDIRRITQGSIPPIFCIYNFRVVFDGLVIQIMLFGNHFCQKLIWTWLNASLCLAINCLCKSKTQTCYIRQILHYITCVSLRLKSKSKSIPLSAKSWSFDLKHHRFIQHASVWRFVKLKEVHKSIVHLRKIHLCSLRIIPFHSPLHKSGFAAWICIFHAQFENECLVETCKVRIWFSYIIKCLI